MELILPRLDGVTPSGSGSLARCPAHADRNPSLRVDEGDDGQALLHCFAGCEIEDIMDALELPTYALFPRGQKASSSPRREPATPVYTTLSWGAQGRLWRAQKALMDSPDTLRRLRDGSGVSAHVGELAGLGYDPIKGCIFIAYALADERTLVALDEWRFREDRDASGKPSYALPRHARPLYVPGAVLAELDTETLYVCEGPMDCLTACSYGHAAVAAPSASSWKADASEWVADLDPGRVIVVGDCDDAGRGFANRAALDLAAHGLRVQILDLDVDRHDGYDVGEHLLAGARLP